MASLTLWARPEPFQLGILPVAPNAKLSVKYLRRIVSYAKSKNQLGYPKLSYSVWKHIACNKLQLPEAMAWMYFVTYRTLHRLPPDVCIQWDNHYARRTESSVRDHLKSLTTVDTMKFVLLLYIQSFNKISLRSASVSLLSQEQWPDTSLGAECSADKSITHRSLKVFEESRHLTFISHRLDEIMDLLCGEKVKAGNERIVSMEIIEALSFLFDGSIDNNKNVIPIHEILQLPSVCESVGFLPSKHGVTYGTFVSWIRKNLILYPFSTASCLSQVGLPNANQGGMYANLTSGPKVHRYLVLTRLNNQTVAKSTETLSGVNVRIHRCKNSYIYLLVPLRSVIITKCQDTTIVLGPVTTTVAVAMCKGLRLIGVCRRLYVTNCQRCTLHLVIPTRPLLVGNRNEDLTLAPFHTTYSKLEEHMAEVGIGQALNLWDEPLCLSDDGHIECQSCWHLLSPEDFYIFNIPFQMEGKTKKVPGTPVPSYQNSMKEKKKQVEAWHYLVESANLSREQRKQLNKLVWARFQIWLYEKGYQRELDGLVACANIPKTK